MKPENPNPLTRWLTDFFRVYPDFPISGVNFVDITPLFLQPEAYSMLLQRMLTQIPKGTDLILAVDARGFLFAGPLAIQSQLPMVLARKAGKLPGELLTQTAEAEYSKDSYSISKGFIKPGSRVVVIDDVLATGNTVVALSNLVKQAGAEVVGSLFAVEIRSLGGREKLFKPFSYTSI